MKPEDFQEMVWQKGRELYREMPWRQDPSPYNVWVSELMLQQTQVSRVIPKFDAFMERFPTIYELSRASLADVLVAWSGLGYNRRAKFLHSAAQKIAKDHDSTLPASYEELLALPGIGPNTAAAICNYAYNIPTPFVETNIRTVYFHHYFPNKTAVSDKEVLEIVTQTLDSEHPREWFWALMDYGAHLKASGIGRLEQSKHYKKQSQLHGSLREMRGRIVKSLISSPQQEASLRQNVAADERFERAMADLVAEGLVESLDGHWRLRGHKG